MWARIDGGEVAETAAAPPGAVRAGVAEPVMVEVTVTEQRPVTDPDTGEAITDADSGEAVMGDVETGVRWEPHPTDTHTVQAWVSLPDGADPAVYAPYGWHPVEERRPDGAATVPGDVRVVRGLPVRDWAVPPAPPAPPDPGDDLSPPSRRELVAVLAQLTGTTRAQVADALSAARDTVPARAKEPTP